MVLDIPLSANDNAADVPAVPPPIMSTPLKFTSPLVMEL
jgi:hypothetical protein